MSQKTNLGKVCVTPKGAHDSTLEYAILDIVTDNGSSYIAIQNVPANTDISDTDYWQLIASKGGTGEITEVTASISGGYGTPGVTVTEGGTTTEKTLAFAFTNLVGSGISSITGEKTGTSGAVDTYTLTITYESGDTDTVTYTVTNGSVTSVAGKTGDVTLDASDIGYDGTTSGLSADDVQDAIDETITDLKEGNIEPAKANLANNFDSKMVLTDNSGYLYRTTGGSLEVGEQNRVKKIVGASVPIIQLISHFSDTYTDHGVTRTWNATTKKYHIEGTVDNARTMIPVGAIPTVEGQKYLVIIKVQGTNDFAVVFHDSDWVESPLYRNLPVSSTSRTVDLSKIAEFRATANRRNYVLDSGDAVSGNINIDVTISFIQLTQTFGTTVANRLYALEQAQAGTGIAKAKEILVKDYYPYNVTAFTHTKTSGKVNNGFNQFDLATWLEQFPDITNVANETLNSKILWTNECGYGGRIQIAKSGFVLKSGSNGRVFFRFLYSDGTTGGSESGNASRLDNSDPITSASGKIVSQVFLSYGDNGHYDLSNGKMCIDFYWDGERDGEYEDYVEWNYPVQDIELKGILSLDAQDNWVADGDEYLPSGVVDENCEEYTILGTETVVDSSFVDPVCYIIIQIPAMKNGSDYGNTTTLPNNITNTLNVYAGQSSGSHNLAIIFNSGTYSSLQECLTAITGNKVIIPLDTPTQTSADPYTELQNDSNWGTEKWIDTRDVPLPVFSTCEYIPDLKAKLEIAPESPDEDGDYIMHRENGLNSYGSLASWLGDNGYAPNVVPTAPAEDGTYTLKVTIADGEATYSWVADT